MIIDSTIKNNKYWNLEYKKLSLLYKITSDEIKTMTGIKNGFTPLLKASSIISLYASSLHFKKVLFKLYSLLNFNLYKHRNIILDLISCILGKIVVFVLYLDKSNSVFLKENVVIFFFINIYKITIKKF